jgi:excisionase family DNA binding protein
MSEQQQAEAVQHDLLTIRQVQERLQLNRDRVYAMVRSGQIPSVRIGGGIRIPRPAYERWVESLAAS